MRAATLTLITSGTATLEGACIGTPMIILYRTSWFNWQLINALTPLENSGLPNLIAGKRIVPELLQDALTPDTLTEHILDLLQNPEKRDAQRDFSHSCLSTIRRTWCCRENSTVSVGTGCIGT